MNVLFICKHNIFRSKVAETYFNQINKNKNIKASSAGIIPGLKLLKSQEKVAKNQALTAKKLGISIIRNPRGLSVKLLKKQDLIILVSDDIPMKVFNNKDYIKKVMQWKIPDVLKNNPKNMEKTIKMIIQKVNKLNNDLK
jgi:protein-tyrosine-phosphatase